MKGVSVVVADGLDGDKEWSLGQTRRVRRGVRHGMAWRGMLASARFSVVPTGALDAASAFAGTEAEKLRKDLTERGFG